MSRYREEWATICSRYQEAVCMLCLGLGKSFVRRGSLVLAAAAALIVAHTAWAESSSTLARPWALSANSFMAGCVDIDHGLQATASGRHNGRERRGIFYPGVQPYVAVRKSRADSSALNNPLVIDGGPSTRYGDAVRRNADQAKMSDTSPVKAAVFTVVGGVSDAPDRTPDRQGGTTADIRPINSQVDQRPPEFVTSPPDPEGSAPKSSSGTVLLLLGFVMLGLVARRRRYSQGNP
jgi:MYXO-CTERM domain-containing protein